MNPGAQKSFLLSALCCWSPCLMDTLIVQPLLVAEWPPCHPPHFRPCYKLRGLSRNSSNSHCFSLAQNYHMSVPGPISMRAAKPSPRNTDPNKMELSLAQQPEKLCPSLSGGAAHSGALFLSMAVGVDVFLCVHPAVRGPRDRNHKSPMLHLPPTPWASFST